MTSPARRPARAAGPPGTTELTRAPVPREGALVATPRHARRTRPPRSRAAPRAPAARDPRPPPPPDVRRPRKADADVPAPRPAGLDLRVDADHARVAVEQRAARVAGVDRGVGLDGARDGEPVRRVDLAPEGGDDAGGERALEAERVADGDGEVADAHAPGVGERQRMQSA